MSRIFLTESINNKELISKISSKFTKSVLILKTWNFYQMIKRRSFSASWTDYRIYKILVISNSNFFSALHYVFFVFLQVFSKLHTLSKGKFKANISLLRRKIWQPMLTKVPSLFHLNPVHIWIRNLRFWLHFHGVIGIISSPPQKALICIKQFFLSWNSKL